MSTVSVAPVVDSKTIYKNLLIVKGFSPSQATEIAAIHTKDFFDMIDNIIDTQFSQLASLNKETTILRKRLKSHETPNNINNMYL